VEVARTAGARFAPDELWAVRGVPVPSWGKSARHQAKTRLQGTEVLLVGIQRDQSVPAAVRLQLKPPVPGRRLTLVRAVDDRGRRMKPRPDWDRYSTSEVLKETGVDLALQGIPGSSRTLDLTIAVQKTGFVDFTARPSPMPPRQGQTAAD